MWKIIKNEGGHSWCQCSCGKEMRKQTSTVIAGASCADCEKLSRVKFKKEDHRLLHILENMKARCYRENHPAYKNYGARGITICDEWLSDTNNFVEWAKAQPDNHLTIERRKNEEGYFPENCYFATRTEQNRNRRNALWIEYNEQRMLVSEAARVSGIDEKTLRGRIKSHPDRPDLWFKKGGLPRGKSAIGK